MVFFNLLEKNKNPKNNLPISFFLRKETRKGKIIFVFNIHRNEIVGYSKWQMPCFVFQFIDINETAMRQPL